MDEILIEEKKYISSKRAAKVTGYAKDYIGQLCREGRVPARLVGRNWYVLESAIHDHRFGQQAITPEHDAAEASTPHQTWEPPRYEASSVEVLPSVNHIRQDAGQPLAGEQHEAPQHLQDSWKEWFDRVADATSAIPDVISLRKPAEEKAVADEKDEKEVQIPIRAIHHERYEAPPEELLPRHYGIENRRTETVTEPITEKRNDRRNVTTAVQAVCVLIAVSMALLASIGSGYFDKYIISYSRASVLTGISTLNK